MLPYFADYAVDTRFGGCKGRGTALCAHLFPLAWSFAAHAGLSACAFFLDAIAAFSKFVLSPQDFDSRTIAALRTLGYDEDVRHELAEHVGDVSVLMQAGASVHLVKMISEVHDGSWHTFQGTSTVTATCFGSKPGDPLGDIVFNFLAARVLNCVYRHAVEAGLMHVLLNSALNVDGHPGDALV